jgi:drug/metabolite transporter (DMT)-like permease
LEPIVFAAMLASAALHASWNAWVKSSPASAEALAAVVIASGVPQGLLLLMAGFPAPAAWPWVLLTVCLSISGLLLLGSAYREGDFAVAYPLIRGLIPVVLALAAVPLFDERPTAMGIMGVVCVSGGLALIAWESARRTRTMTLRGLGFAALAAGITALSVLTDTKGARVAGNPISYAATISVLNAVVMAGVYRVRGNNVSALLFRHRQVAVGGGLIATVSYILFIWSLMQAPVAMVSAVRETSMLFAVAIAAVVLQERVGSWRWAAVTMMFAGLLLVRYSQAL